jgi:hypothetical protein
MDTMDFTKEECKLLRTLAGRTAELAARPEEAVKQQLWTDHNELKPTRPLVFCDPENGWHEIIPDSDLACISPLAREWEFALRKEIFWGTRMKDDRVIPGFFPLNWVWSDSGWGLEVKKHGGNNGGSYSWEAPLTDYSLMDHMHLPRISIDHGQTSRRFDLATDIFGDLLPPKLKASFWWTLGMTWTLIDLRGLQNFMMDLIDEPDNLHRLMSVLKDGHLAKLAQLEREGLLTLNNDSTYVGSGGFGWTGELPAVGRNPRDATLDCPGTVTRADLWGFGESQETIGVSPAMFEEFIFPYQLELLSGFGLLCYGCCEPLDHRWEIVKRLPHLRRASVSPWASIPAMAEYLGTEYIYSMKGSPMPLAEPVLDEDTVRSSLREAMHSTRNCRVELIMKDNHTLGGNPENAVRWTAIAMQEAVGL